MPSDTMNRANPDEPPDRRRVDVTVGPVAVPVPAPAAPLGAAAPPTPGAPNAPGTDGWATAQGPPRRRHLEWAAAACGDPAMSAADWLADDILPGSGGALALVGDPATPLEALRRAKDAFKTMRIMGEQTADRRLGARLYLAAIASALAFHDQRISAQSDEALARALERARDDGDEPLPLRHLATVALRKLAK
ncbi:MAG: hypothetical protein U0575_03740 [Phycisphaerales bacterium]